MSMNMCRSFMNNPEFDQFAIMNEKSNNLQKENFSRQKENGSFQSVSDFDDEQTRGGIPEQTRRMNQSVNPVNTPYKPVWKPRQTYTERKNSYFNMNKSLQEEESGFHFTIAKLNCNYSPVISKFSVCETHLIFYDYNHINSERKIQSDENAHHYHSLCW